MASTLPAPFGDEIKGIARATNLPLGTFDHRPYNIITRQTDI